MCGDYRLSTVLDTFLCASLWIHWWNLVKKSYRSLPTMSGTKMSPVCANPAFLRIKVWFMVGESGVLRSGNNVFDARPVPMMDCKKLFGGNNLKALPKPLWTCKTIISFHRESFKTLKERNCHPEVLLCTRTHAYVPRAQLRTVRERKILQLSQRAQVQRCGDKIFRFGVYFPLCRSRIFMRWATDPSD